MGNNREIFNIANAISEKLPFLWVPKIISRFDGSNNIFVDCKVKSLTGSNSIRELMRASLTSALPFTKRQVYKIFVHFQLKYFFNFKAFLFKRMTPIFSNYQRLYYLRERKAPHRKLQFISQPYRSFIKRTTHIWNQVFFSLIWADIIKGYCFVFTKML